MVANIRSKIAFFAYILVISAVAASGLGSRFVFVGSLVKEASAQELPAGQVDTDGDGLTDVRETTVYHTDPLKADTDGDGYPDGLEVEMGYSPLNGGGKKMVDVDTDKDYLNDAWEVAIGTDLANPDSDGDKYLDGTEVAASFDPLNPLPIKSAKNIRVSIKDQRLWYYFDDKLLETFLVSTGKRATPTPVGEFRIEAKVPVKHYGGVGFDYPNTKWNLLFTRARGWGVFIHGAYWHHNFGKQMSHGCVNVSYANMGRLYSWAQDGTKVIVQ